MALRIDKVQLQFDIKPNYEAQQLNKLKDDLSEANKKLEELKDEKKSLHKPKKKDTQAWADYQRKLEDVNKRIGEQERVVDRATKAVENQKQKMGLNALTLRELQNELKRYNAILNNLQPGTENFEKTKRHIDDIKNRIKEIKGTTSLMVTDTRNSLLKFAEGFNVFGFAFTNLKSIISTVTDWVKQGAQAWWDYNKQLAESARLTREFLGLTGGGLEAVRADILATAEVYGKDYKEVLKTVDYLMAQYQLTAQEAMKVVNDGFQAGADLSGDMLSKIQRYAPAFHDAGISAQELVAYITQTRSGIFTDQGMALMEMAVKKIREMSDQTRQSLQAIGISDQQVADTMQQDGIIGVVRLISSEIKKLPPDAQEVGDVMSDVFGRQGTAGGYQMIAALQDLDTNLDNLKQNTGEYGELLSRQQEIQAELNQVTAQLFGFSEDGFDNLVTKAKILIMEGLLAIINYCRDLYDELAIVRVSVEAVRFVFDTAFKIIEGLIQGAVIEIRYLANALKATGKLIEAVFPPNPGKIKAAWKELLDNFQQRNQQFAEKAKDIGFRWGENFINSAKRVISGRAAELMPEGGGTTLPEVVIKAPRVYKPLIKSPVSGGTTTAKNDAPDPYQTDLAALEKNRREALNVLKQSLVEGKMTEEEYRVAQTEQQKAYLQGKLALEQKYGKDTSDTEGQILDSTINEANKKRQQQLADEKQDDQARLQQRRETLQQMQQAEKEAIEKGNKADNADDVSSFFAEALFQADLMRSLDLISFEDYEKQKTAIAEAEQKKQTELNQQAEQQRQQIREAFAQQAGQLMSATSSLFSAMQSREESRVDAKYKKLIASAKKNGKDTTKLEEQQEAEKMAIKKKYANKSFMLTVLQVIANAAQGISKIWAEWGWNPPVATALTATESAVAAIQLATAKAQRDQAAGLYGGGYNDEYAEGYTGDGDPKKVAGVIPVHKREFVINHEALKIPAVRRVADVIDSMQKRKAYSMQNTSRDLMNSVAGMGLLGGGYNQSPAPRVAAEGGGVGVDVGRVVDALDRNTRLLEEMLESGITILELRRQIRRQEQLENNASR